MSSRFFRRSRAALAALALCGGATVAVVAATGGTASASQSPSQSSSQSPFYLGSDSSGLYLDYDDTGSGDYVIQATPDNNGAQAWTIPSAGSTGWIRNWVNHWCLTTNGTAGDQLYLAPCERRWAAYERWRTFGGAPGVGFLNPHFGLVVDVYNGDMWSGSPIDAWPFDEGANQWFQKYSA